jgi:hypothetical protein
MGVEEIYSCGGLTAHAVLERQTGPESERTRGMHVVWVRQPEEVHREIAIHFPGVKGLEKPIVWVFPEVLVCLSCGNAEFVVPERELRVLAKDDAGSASDATANSRD